VQLAASVINMANLKAAARKNNVEKILKNYDSDVHLF
jgi:hypothetical protein